MLHVRSIVLAIGIAAAGCGLFPNLDSLSPADGGPGEASLPGDSGPDAKDDAAEEDGATCTCTGLVSAYAFALASDLGRDSLGNNDMVVHNGAPAQSTITPPGLTGYSIQLDGKSDVCIQSGYTFNTNADHTLCWWSQPASLVNDADMFAQTCTYDTWTTNSGTAYLWRINNCNGGTSADLIVSNVYTLSTWVQICQTYSRAALRRTVVVNGQTSAKTSLVDSVPVTTSSSPWCIGSYGGGGFWTGLIYGAMWFNRVLSDAEIQQVYGRGCCLP